MSDQAQSGQKPKSSIKETIISVVIAFALAFVFRGFVVEAFVIPTGSMAPTLLGKHVRFQYPESGYDWAVGPMDYTASGDQPLPVQAVGNEKYDVHDPMSGAELNKSEVPLRAGDRIFVQKYLYPLFAPTRFDVVVFKYPGDPTQNFIKRLLGLPGEQVALVDGDVFVREATPEREREVADGEAWSGEGWTIARKPQRIQRAVWQTVFDSRYTPLDSLEFSSPWLAQGEGWNNVSRSASYRHEGASAGVLAWDATRRPIVDVYPYNETEMVRHLGRGRTDVARRLVKGPGVTDVQQGVLVFPVSDIAMRCGVEPDSDGASISAVLHARLHEFRGTFAQGRVTLEMRPVGSESWNELASAEVGGLLEPGTVSNVSFWHADQALSMWVGERRVLYHEYDWSPMERLENSLTIGADEALAFTPGADNLLTDSDLYRKPSARWELSGSPMTLHRVALARDLHYQANNYGPRNDNNRVHSYAGEPALATHPSSTATLDPSEYFVCGDNSPASSDGRLWDVPNDWVARTTNSKAGVVHADLLIGKAFFVYFPAPLEVLGKRIMPDAGSLRWIW